MIFYKIRRHPSTANKWQVWGDGMELETESLIDATNFVNSKLSFGEDFRIEPIKPNFEYGIRDAINPDHYRQGSIECIIAIEAATVNKKGIEAVCTANAIKYLWRYEAKNGLEDVKKAKWYLEELIKHLEHANTTGNI